MTLNRVLISGLMTGLLLVAQPPRREPTPNDTLKSPEVMPDHRVTFRIYAPKASEVSVGGDWIAQGRGTGAGDGAPLSTQPRN